MPQTVAQTIYAIKVQQPVALFSTVQHRGQIMTEATRNLLEQHFDTAFAAPDGIARLRELILTLAMQGKLVEQDPKDPPASELLKEIEADKRRQVKAGKIKKPKSLPAIDQSDASYVLPENWTWTRLGTIGNIFNGNSINAREKETKYAGANGLPYIATKDVGYGLDALDYKNGIYIPESEEKFKIAHQGAVLICAEGGSAGKKCGITEQDICFGNKLFANELFGGIPSKFILYLYLSPVFRDSFNAAMTGIIGGVSIAKFLELPVPLPPLKEQHRIVARIDQLMARCDELEKLRKAREEKRLAVHAAAIKQLLDAPDGTAWGFIEQHFGELHTVKENVAELRKAILQLAVMGRLVPQDPNDPPASVLLKEIKKERASREDAKTRRKGKELPPIKPEEVPYELPQGWEWVRVWDIAQLITSGSRDWAKYYSDSGAIFVTMGNLSRGNYQLRMDTIRYVSPPTDGEGSRTKLEEKDLLISITGDVGNLGLIPANFGEAYINQHTCLLRFMPSCRNRYFPELMRSPLAKEQFDAPQRGIKNSFRLGDVGEMIIPLPPLPEQHHIVARIDQLMSLCDTLDQQIDAATGKQTELLNAVMAEV
jgi:type I restriction enzyme S subunit